MEKKQEIVYGQRKDQRGERKQEAKEERKAEGKGEEPGVIYASLGTRLYLFFPWKLFYICDLIKSNKSQCPHTHTHTHTPTSTHTATTTSPDSGIVNISSHHLLHPRLNKSRLWCITRHIIHVVYRSKICKQTRGIKVIDAQMGPFFCSVLISHTAPSTVTYTCLVWDEDILYGVLTMSPHDGYLYCLCAQASKRKDFYYLIY